MPWIQQELNAIAKDGDLHISIPNPDGTMHAPAWVWIAQAGNELYSRGYSGTESRWYKAAKTMGWGHISVGGVEKDVMFEFPNDSETNDAVDEGYRMKFAGSPYLQHMLGAGPRAATVKLIPRE
jgi:hypothetical protein